MSGVEVLGLLLAIIPIFQAATDPKAQLAPFEHILTAFSSRRKTQKLDEFLKNLHYEVSMLQITLSRLIDQLDALTDGHRSQLKLGNGWQEYHVVDALQHRLGYGYDSFYIHLTELLEQLESLVEDKTIDLPLGQTEITSPHAALAKLLELRRSLGNEKANSDLIGRLRFSFSHPKRLRTLNEIKENNTRLEGLLGHQPPSSADVKGSNRGNSSSTIQLRPLMHTLYETLGGLWRCDCPLPHRARFCLLKSSRDKTSEPDDPLGAVYFDMLTSIQADATDEYCKWVASRICIVLNDYQLTRQTSRTVRFSGNLTDPTPPASPLARTLSGMTAVSSATRGPNKTPMSPPLSPTTSNTQKVIESICEVIMLGIRRACCPRMLFDGMTLSHMRPTRQTLDIETSEPSTSLATLLAGQRKFNLREKRILAVILAHSMLHFCESPWTNQEWSKHHVSFFKRSKQGDFDLERPWLSPDFANPCVTEDVDKLNSMHPNPSVLALGILLLEIELGDVLESFREACDLSPEGLENCDTAYFTAYRVWENKLDNAYWGYRAAVEACLKCNFFEREDGGPLSLEDKDFHEAVYEHIVQPLEKELWIACRVKPEEIGLESF